MVIVADDLDAAGLHDGLAQLHADVRNWTSNDLQLVEHSRSSWNQLVRNRDPPVDEIRRDGIVLAGEGSALELRQ